MKGKLKKSSLMIVAILLICTFVFTPIETFAASKGQPQYFRCIKKGNSVYCSDVHRLYKVNLETKEVKTIMTARCYLEQLRIKGKYLYFIDRSQGIGLGYIYRMNLKTGKVKCLAKNAGSDYYLKGNKIYYTEFKNLKAKTYRMKLNGKSKKRVKTKVHFETKIAATKTPGYKVIAKPSNISYMSNIYLQTPNGDIFLERFYTYF